MYIPNDSPLNIVFTSKSPITQTIMLSLHISINMSEKFHIHCSVYFTYARCRCLDSGLHDSYSRSVKMSSRNSQLHSTSRLKKKHNKENKKKRRIYEREMFWIHD